MQIEGHAAILVDLAAQAGDAGRGLQERLGGRAAERDQMLGPDEIELPLEEGPGVGAFLGRWRAIAGRSALERVEDKDFLALEAAGIDDPRQELTGPADEWLALPIFILAGRFAAEGDIGIYRPDAEDGLGSSREEVGTTITLRDLGGEEGQFVPTFGEWIGRGEGAGPAANVAVAVAAILSGFPRGTKSTPAVRSDSR